jgi:hypothetical protein
MQKKKRDGGWVGASRVNPLGLQIVELMYPDTLVMPAAIAQMPKGTENEGLYISWRLLSMLPPLKRVPRSWTVMWRVGLDRSGEIEHAVSMCQRIEMHKRGASDAESPSTTLQ